MHGNPWKSAKIYRLRFFIQSILLFKVYWFVCGGLFSCRLLLLWCWTATMRASILIVCGAWRSTEPKWSAQTLASASVYRLTLVRDRFLHRICTCTYTAISDRKSCALVLIVTSINCCGKYVEPNCWLVGVSFGCRSVRCENTPGNVFVLLVSGARLSLELCVFVCVFFSTSQHKCAGCHGCLRYC